MKFFGSKNSEFKRWHLGVLVIVLATSVFLRWYNSRLFLTTIQIGNREFSVYEARTNAQRVKGLGGRDKLEGAEGMLFTNAGVPGYYVIVMRDMRFPIDIVWLNKGKIVDMAPNVPIDNAKAEQEFKEYRPRLQATEVLEFPAGFIANYGLKIGDIVNVGK